MRVCPCGREVRGGQLCQRCVSALVSELRDVPSIVDDLDIMLASRYRTGDPMRAVASLTDATTELVASLAAERLTGKLAAWACTLGRTAVCDVHQPVQAVALALWLTRRRDDIRQHPLAGQLRDEITEVIRDARDTVECPPTVYLGPCWACARAVYGCEREGTAWCRACGAAFDAEARRDALLDQSINVWSEARELLRALPEIAGRSVTVSAIEDLIRRGLITTRTGRNGHRERRTSDVTRFPFAQAPPEAGDT